MRKSHIISLFVMFGIVSAIIIVAAATGTNPRTKLSQATPTEKIVFNPTATPDSTVTDVPETPTSEPTEEPTPTPAPTPVVRPQLDYSSFDGYPTKKVEFNVSGKLDNDEDPESRVYAIDTVATDVLGSHPYIYRIADAEGTFTDKKIYLTFNLSYEDKYGSTEKILDILKEKGVTAAFFISKNYLDDNPDLVRRMLEEGHVIGSRGDLFAKGTGGTGMTYLENKAFSDTLWLMEEDFQKIAGDNMRMMFFRPDKFSERDLAILEAMGYKVVFRAFNYYDWDDTEPTGALKKMLENNCSGAVYQLSSSKVNAEILADYIDSTREKGYTFASLE